MFDHETPSRAPVRGNNTFLPHLPAHHHVGHTAPITPAGSGQDITDPIMILDENRQAFPLSLSPAKKVIVRSLLNGSVLGSSSFATDLTATPNKNVTEVGVFAP